jgi:hypothetical protein
MSISSTCIGHIHCDDCGSSDSRAVYLNVDTSLGVEWYTSFCYSTCYEQKGDPYSNSDTTPPKPIVKDERDIAQELQDIKDCKMFLPNKYRGIPKQTYKSWKLKLMLSEFDGKTPYAVAFPMSSNLKLTGYKCRPFKSKNFFAKGKTGDTDPFGLVRALRIESNVLWITEGEFDAIALDYCLSEVSKRQKQFPVISLTHGGGSIRKNLNHIDKYLERYGQVRLVLDDDEVGHKAERTALAMYGNKIKIIEKPVGCKDANDAVLNGETWSMGHLALFANNE